jgi:hypothetical protein
MYLICMNIPNLEKPAESQSRKSAHLARKNWG